MTRITIANREYQVPDRVTRMVVWLMNQMERIEQTDRVRVEFNCAGGRIVTDIREGGKA